MTRLARMFDLGGGSLLHPWLRRQGEGRALAALEPVAAPLSVVVRQCAWPMPRQWGSQGSDPGQFDEPRGVALTSGGDVVVCDYANHRVQVLRPDGTFVCQWGGLSVPEKIWQASVTICHSSFASRRASSPLRRSLTDNQYVGCGGCLPAFNAVGHPVQRVALGDGRAGCSLSAFPESGPFFPGVLTRVWRCARVSWLQCVSSTSSNR